MRITAGTLYGAIDRLIEQGLVAADGEDTRRPYAGVPRSTRRGVIGTLVGAASAHGALRAATLVALAASARRAALVLSIADALVQAWEAAFDPAAGFPGTHGHFAVDAWTDVSTLPREPWRWLVPSLLLPVCILLAAPRPAPGAWVRAGRIGGALALAAGLGVILIAILAAAVVLSPLDPPLPDDAGRGRPHRRRRDLAAHRRIRCRRRRIRPPAARREPAPELDSPWSPKGGSAAMAMVSMRQLLDEAAAGGYGVGAFNVNNMEQIQAIMEAARETSSPVIIQASRGARSYTNDRFLFHLMQAAVELYPEIPVALHQDHGNSPETCFSAIDQGFTSVMMDGSLLADGKTPSDFAYNVQVTREVVERAHSVGVTVEGELGTLGGIEDGVGSGEVHLTDPGQAVEFVEETGIDALAVAIGTSHGAYKFSRKPDGEVLAMNLIQEIHEKLPATHLVMHGSSSVPKELVDVINEYGGQIRPTWGVPVEEIQLGIRHGVRKINVDTDSRLAITGAIRKAMAEDPGEFDPRSYLKPARAAMQAVIAERMRQFGQAGHAGDYDPRSPADMRDFYAGATA